MSPFATALAACLLSASPAPSATPAPAATPAEPVTASKKGPPDPPSLSAQPGAGPRAGLETVVEAAYAGMAGEWAEYAALRGGKPDFTDTIRFSILADDNPALPPWIEIWMDKLGRTAARLRRGEKVGGQMFFKMGSVIYSVDSFAAFVPKGGEGCASGECKGPPKNQRPWTPVSLTTAAGPYKCRYAKLPTEKGSIDVWYADDIPATHLAKIRLSDGTGYEIVASGKGAISSFPRKFNAVTLPLESPKIVEALAPKMAPPSPPADAGTASPDAGAPRPLKQWGEGDAGR
ncbi:MAG: hypothetical protein QM765_41705 [Myxococcales bacterium]